MLGKYIKSKFGKEEEISPQDQFYSSLRIGLATMVNLNLVDLLVAEGKHKNFVLPSSGLSVLAIGTLRISGKQPLYRFYLKDFQGEEFILLIAENNGKVTEATLYKELTVIEPQTEAEWDRYLSAIGFQDQDFDEYKYTRVWGSKYTEKEELVSLEEEIVTPDELMNCPSSYMLYSRQIESLVGDPIDEFLLVGVEETVSEAKLSFQVGFNVLEKDIKIQ